MLEASKVEIYSQLPHGFNSFGLVRISKIEERFSRWHLRPLIATVRARVSQLWPQLPRQCQRHYQHPDQVRPEGDQPGLSYSSSESNAVSTRAAPGRSSWCFRFCSRYPYLHLRCTKLSYYASATRYLPLLLLLQPAACPTLIPRRNDDFVVRPDSLLLLNQCNVMASDCSKAKRRIGKSHVTRQQCHIQLSIPVSTRRFNVEQSHKTAGYGSTLNSRIKQPFRGQRSACLI